MNTLEKLRMALKGIQKVAERQKEANAANEVMVAYNQGAEDVAKLMIRAIEKELKD